MLLYADSSDEDERDVESQVAENDEVFSLMTTNPGQRNDSLKEVVLLKDTKAASFNEKQKSKGGVTFVGRQTGKTDSRNKVI